MKKNTFKKMGFTGCVVLVFLIVYAFSLFALYLWGFLTSLKTNLQFSQNPYGIPPGAPWQWAWENYEKAFKTVKVFVDSGAIRRNVYLPEMLWNSTVFSVGGALINNLTTWLIAYLIVKFKRYKISRMVFILNIALMTVPVIGNLPSALMIFRLLGWYDSWLFIIFNNISFTGFYLLIYYAFINSLGKENYEAAYIDGAGNFTIMTKIAFPLTASMFFVVLLLLSIARWNDYMTMIIWMPNYPTLAYGIYKMSVSIATEASFPPIQIAASMVLMLPMLVLFFIFQKPIMGNLRVGSFKG